jgi:methyl-accepting chemotaxis protein
MSIKKKLLISSFLFLVLLFLLVLILWRGSRAIETSTETSYSLATEQMYLQMLLRGLNETIITEGTPSSIEISTTAISGFTELHANLKGRLKNTGLGDKINTVIDPEWQAIVKGVTPFLEVDLDTESDELMMGYGKIITKTDNLLSKLDGLSEEAVASALSTKSRSKKYSFLAITCIIVLGSIVFISLYRSIAGAVSTVENSTKIIASGNLTQEVRLRGEDEMSSIGTAINKMVHSLKDILSRISDISNSISNATSNIGKSSKELLSTSDIQSGVIKETVAATNEINEDSTFMMESAKNMSHAAVDTASAILQMKAAIDTIAENTAIFSESAHETASFIEELVINIQQIGKSVDKLSGSSEEIASSVDEVNATVRDIEDRAKESVVLAETVMTNASDRGMTASNAVMKGMGEIKKRVVSFSEVINVLGKKTDDIGKILNVIDEVTDQTNLLALNAAILAAQSGEHGKGFSVVADEIKALAERTSASTSEIVRLIKSVQSETQSSIQIAAESTTTVDNGLKLVDDLNSTLKNIIDSSRESTDMAKAIQKATEEEALAVKQITAAVESMTAQTEKISYAIQEQSKGSNFITKETDKVKNLSSDVKRAIEEQKEGSGRIADSMDNVSKQASQIADTTVNQKEKSKTIVSFMEKIVVKTDDLKHFSNKLDEVVTILGKEASDLTSVTKKFKT